jgi:hypothetical protein
MLITGLSALTIRPAYADDQLAVQRLAALDSADAIPAAPLLLAEVDGELRVALSLREGTAIADPFFPTAAIVKLLRTHAGMLQPSPPARMNGRFLPWRRGLDGLAGFLRAGSA